MDYACPAWRSTTLIHVRRLQVLQSKCLHLATGASWYVSNRQIHEDLGVPLFADHIRALTASFDWKLADVGNTLVRQLGRYLRWPRVDPVAWRESQGRQGPAGQSRPSPAMTKSTKRMTFGSAKRLSATLTEVFRDFPQLQGKFQGIGCKVGARLALPSPRRGGLT